jgi:hypothetical protein
MSTAWLKCWKEAVAVEDHVWFVGVDVDYVEEGAVLASFVYAHVPACGACEGDVEDAGV